MTIKEFATAHRLQIKTDEEGEFIVRAKHGQIYEYGPGQFGAMFMFETKIPWNNRRRECERAGMKVIQDGETEGTLLFDSENRDQAKVAIKTVGAYRKVNLSPEQRQAKAERMARVREFKNPPPISDERG
jgi:hypothetical protein